MSTPTESRDRANGTTPCHYCIALAYPQPELDIHEAEEFPVRDVIEQASFTTLLQARPLLRWKVADIDAECDVTLRGTLNGSPRIARRKHH